MKRPNRRRRRSSALRALVWSVFICRLLPGQPPPGIPERKDSIVVTGSWDPLPLEEADRSVAAFPIRGQDLLFNSFVDVLRLDSSVDVRQRAPNGIQADLSIRGASFAQTLVLLNGRRMNDPQSGHHNMDVAVPLEALDSTEILRGAGSTLYGSDALGGVANLRAKPPEATEVRLRATLGNFGVNQERASLAAVRGPWMQQLLVSRDFSTGFMPNRDYRNLTGSSVTQWRSRAGVSSVDLGYADKPFGADQFYGNFNSWERTKTWYTSGHQTLGEKTEAAASYRRHTDLFVLYRDRPQVYTNHHIGESWQATVRRRETLAWNTALHYGAEGYGDHIMSSNLGGHDRQRAATYAVVDLRALGRFSLNAGVRTESYRGAFDQVNPTLSGGYWFSARWKARASVSRAFRLPTYTDLYYRDPANQGNPNLKPETAWNYEAGLQWHPGPRWIIDGAVFQRRDRDVIDYVRTSPTSVWQATNFQRLTFSGFEGSVAWRWRSSVLDLRYTGLRGVSEAVAGVQSKYVFNYPVHSGVVSWLGTYRGISARTRVGVLERLARAPYAVWDLYAARAQGRIRPFFQFTNLSATVYQEIPGVAMPGRGIVGGVEWLVWR